MMSLVMSDWPSDFPPVLDPVKVTYLGHPGGNTGDELRVWALGSKGLGSNSSSFLTSCVILRKINNLSCLNFLTMENR